MLLTKPKPYRYEKKKPTAPPPLPTTLTLIAAAFDDATETLAMTFDRPVSIAAYDGTQTLVNVPATGSLYAANSHVTRSPDGRTVTAEGEVVEASDGPVAWLSVPPGSGIVDAATGAAWAGVAELALPFGMTNDEARMTNQ